jgi:hypothetical protein
MGNDYKSKFKVLGARVEKMKKELVELRDWKRRAETALHFARCPIHRDEHKDDYKKTFDLFWKEIVMNGDGSWNFEQVKKELHDFHSLMGNVPRVYMHASGNIISNPMTHAEHVIAAFDERLDDDYREEMRSLRASVEKEKKRADRLERRFDELKTAKEENVNEK